MSESPTWTLEATNGDIAGRTYPIDEKGLSLGRGEFNEVILNSNNVSRQHARVFLYGGQAWVRDEGSRNGIYVNGNRVQQHGVVPGDMVGVGEYIFRITGPAVVPQAGAQAPGPGVSPSTAPPEGRSKKPLIIGAAVVVLLIVGIAVVGSGGGAPPAPEPAGAGEQAAVDPGKANMFNFSASKKGQAGGPGGSGAVDPSQVDVASARPADGAGGSDERNAQLVKEYLDKAQLFQEAGKLKEARDLLDRAVKLDRTCELCQTRLEKVTIEIARSTQKYYDDGLRYFNSLRYEEAISEWEVVLNLIDDPNNEMYRKTQENISQARQKMGVPE